MSFVEDEHPRDGDGKFATKGGDQSKSTRDTILPQYVEKYEDLINKYSDDYVTTKKDLEAELKELEEYRKENDIPEENNLRSSRQLTLQTRLGNIERNMAKQQEFIGLINEASSLIEEHDLFTIIQGNDTHKPEYKGFKNMIDAKNITKKWNLNLDERNRFISTKLEWYTDVDGNPQKELGHKQGSGIGVSEKLFDEEVKGKQMMITNITSGAKTPEWARDQLKQFNDVWNNILSDEERSNIDVIKINWTTKEKLQKAKDVTSGGGVTLGSMLPRKNIVESIMQHPSVLTMNLLESEDEDKNKFVENLNTVIHEIRHGVWNNKVRHNDEKREKFVSKILERGKDKALTWYVKEKWTEMENMEDEYKEEVKKLDKIKDAGLRKKQSVKLEEDHKANMKWIETVIANETHSEYFSVLGAPSMTHIKSFDIENMKDTSSLIKEIIYDED